MSKAQKAKTKTCHNINYAKNVIKKKKNEKY